MVWSLGLSSGIALCCSLVKVQGPSRKLCQAQGIYVSSLTHFLCCKVQVSLAQSEGQASSASTRCISYCFFHLPSDPIASFPFGLYLMLHQPTSCYLSQQNLTAERALCLPVSQLNLSFRLLWPLLPPRMLTLPGSWYELFSNPLRSTQLSFLPWTLSLQNSISCLSGAHTWRLLLPGLRLSLLRHVPTSSSLAVPRGCCVSHRTAAGFVGIASSLLSIFCRASAGRQGASPSFFVSLWLPAPKPSPGNEDIPPNDCTAFAKVWGLLSAAPHSVQLQGSVPSSGAMALRGAGLHPSSSSQTALGGG